MDNNNNLNKGKIIVVNTAENAQYPTNVDNTTYERRGEGSNWYVEPGDYSINSRKLNTLELNKLVKSGKLKQKSPENSNMSLSGSKNNNSTARSHEGP